LATTEIGTPIPDGWADPDSGFSFVVGPERKIVACDPARGRTRWATTEPGFPLGLADGRLWVLSQDRIQALDPSTGKVLITSQALGLGGWSILGSSHSHGGQSFTHRELFTEGALLLEWSAMRSRVTGYAGLIKEGEGGGKVRVDLKTGAVEAVQTVPASEGSPRDKPEFLAKIESSLPAGASLAWRPSLNGRHILARIVPPGESVDWGLAPKLSFVWDLYDRISGKRLASPKIPLLVKDFTVVRDRLFCLWEHEQPGAFHERELQVLTFEGRKAWTLKLWAAPTYPPVP